MHPLSRICLKSFSFFLFALAVHIDAFCAPPTTVSLQPELVLREGARLEARAGSEKIVILAGPGLARQYQWDGCVVNANMQRRSSRWFGNLGVYDPVGGRRVPFGVGRLLYPSCPESIYMPVEEGQMHFPSVRAAEEWLRHISRKPPHRALWSDDGVVVQFTSSRRNSDGTGDRGMSVSLTLICINGLRPTRLMESTANSIAVIDSLGAGAGIHECKKVSDTVISETQRVLNAEWKTWVKR